MIRNFIVNTKKKIKRKADIFLYTTSDGFIEIHHAGFKWKLNPNSCITQSIIDNGVWEADTTNLIQDLVKPGMQVLDIGANFGYYSLILAKRVGPNGKVWAFEPVKKFRDQLIWHIHQNGLEKVIKVVPYGLSDKESFEIISIDDSAATLYWTNSIPSEEKEQICLKRLDDITNDLGIDRIDFIKLDIDGNEPKFFRGASITLKKFHPPIAIEFAQHCLHIAGSDVREQAKIINDLGYVICNEKTQKPFASELDFLRECGNFDHSGNAIALPKTIIN